MHDCVFCNIISGTAPARMVYQDDDVVAFLDIRPVAVGHTLVIPRRHAANLEEINDDDVSAVVRVARLIARGLRHSSYGADGVNLMVNDGRAAMQTVYHHHMHVVPRSHGDKLRFAKSLLVRKDPDPDATAERVRAAIAAATA